MKAGMKAVTLITFPDVNQVVHAPQIQLSKDSGSREGIQGGLDERERMVVLDGTY